MYPGSFDPITCGHIDIINRASKFCNKLIVAVLVNKEKKPFFSFEERIELIKETTKDLDNIEVITFDGLLVNLFKTYDIDFIIKGLRAVSDFEYEFQMAQINKALEQRAETLFMMTSPRYSYLSSSVVKEIFLFGGEINNFVPPIVRKAMNKKKEMK